MSYQMKTYRLTVEVEVILGLWVVTLLDDSKTPRPTIACQAGSTPKEAICKIARYLEREVTRQDIEWDIIEGRT